MNAAAFSICRQCKKLFPFHEIRAGMCFACCDQTCDEMARDTTTWFTVNDGIRQDEIEAMDEVEAKMAFIERYDLTSREHDFVHAVAQQTPTMTPIEQRIRHDEAA